MSNDKLTVKESATLLDVTIQHMRLLLREGKLKGAKWGRDWVVDKASVEEYDPRRRSSDQGSDTEE